MDIFVFLCVLCIFRKLSVEWMPGRSEGLALMLPVPLLWWINSSSLWQSTLKVRLHTKRGVTVWVLPLMGGNFPCPPNASWWGWHLEMEMTQTLFYKSIFLWFYCFNFTAKLNLRWELLTVWLNIWHPKMTFIHLGSEKWILREIYAHFSFQHVFFSFSLYYGFYSVYKCPSTLATGMLKMLVLV